MGLSNIYGLVALGFVPLIVILYMLRPKHTQKKIPSIFLWQSVMDEIESASKIHKLRSSILMILQILAVILLALILAGLFIRDDQVYSEVIVVVDGSISMHSDDIEPSRHAYAKALATDFVKHLDEGTLITLVNLTDTVDIVVSKTKDKPLALGGIDSLLPSNSRWDSEVVTETLSALRQEGTTVVYFGDNPIENVKSYLTLKSRDNIGIYDLVSTTYEKDNMMSVLTEVFNEGDETVNIPVSLYLDDLFFAAKEIEVEGGSSAKLLFDSLPLEGNVITAVIDRDDILPLDNTAQTVIKKDTIQNVLLVSEGNLFLEKVLKLEQNIEVYQVTPNMEKVYEGYDLYIFDGTMPQVMPTDGAMMFFDPPENDVFEGLGYVEHPDISTAGHSITYGIEKPEFLAASTEVFNVPDSGVPIYETSYGTCAYSDVIGHQKVIVYGFDIHQTDLPLNIEFPILMSASFRHLLTQSAIEESSIGSGDSIEIYLKPSTLEAYIVTPNEMKIPLDLTKERQLFTGTDTLGLYNVIQLSSDRQWTEAYAVNAKRPTEGNAMSKATGAGKSIIDGKKSLHVWLGIVLLMIVMLEWSIYGMRRKKA